MTPFAFDTLNHEVLPSDSIVDAPSLVTPILIKRKENKFKKLIEELNKSDKNDTPIEDTKDAIRSEIDTNNQHLSNDEEQGVDDDDIEIIKVVDKNASTQNLNSNDTNIKTLEDVIRSTTIATLTKSPKTNKNASILTINDYFASAPGKLLMSIGLSRALEVSLKDEAYLLSKKAKKDKNQDSDVLEELATVKEKFFQAKKFNQPFKGQQIYKCPNCKFRSESNIELSAHLEKPHQNSRREYSCNWCKYRIKDPNQLIFHCYTAHKQRCYIEKQTYPYSCRFCSFDAKSKRKFESHMAICEENFNPNKLLMPQNSDCDYPAITSKFIVKEDIATYERTLKDIRLASYNPNVLRVPNSQKHHNSYQAIFVVPIQNNFRPYTQNKTYSRQTSKTGPLGSSTNIMGDSLSGQIRVPNQSVPNLSSQLLHSLTNRNIGQESHASLQYPKNQSSFANGKLIADNISDVIINKSPGYPKENDSIMNNPCDLDFDEPIELTSSKSSTFVICEICDGYIKDLIQLKSHMRSLHKITLSQKTFEFRPPLNCQKCHWRFFTDHGLERHLLGAHGLVTSHMRELAEKNSDSGRCTICGRAYANKLVAHMKDVHKSTLKPAHISYKCRVCSASFNTYGLFGNHVHTFHSDAINRSSSAT